jgi:hypothetical protein
MDNSRRKEHRVIDVAYWTIALCVFLAQTVFTLSSTSQIRYEELAEAVRNVFWLHNRLVYDGISSNVGWYGTLLVMYNVFGFSLNTAKFFRLAVHLVSLFFLALLLRQYLGTKRAWLPLLAIGLSPTIIFFNSLQTSFGIDCDYLIISIFVLAKITFKKGSWDIVKQNLFWSINMIAWLSYPVYIFYLPSLAILYLLKVKNNIDSKLSSITLLSLNTFSFLLPLVLSFLFVVNKNTLWNDPIATGGVFRGAGTIRCDVGVFSNNITHLAIDLFNKGNSYYFEVAQAEFSNYYPLIGLVFVGIVSLWLIFTNEQYRVLASLAVVTLILNLLIAGVTVDPTTYPGLRRNTALISSFYILLTISWHYLNSRSVSAWFRWLALTLCLLIPFHHLLVYPSNLNALQYPSRFQYRMWSQTSDSPNHFLDALVAKAKSEPLYLNCLDKTGKPVFCRYNETYAAVAGECVWNRLECKPILGYDDKTNRFLTISPTLWQTYYWPH